MQRFVAGVFLSFIFFGACVTAAETTLREIEKQARSLEEIQEIYRDIRKVSSQYKKECSHASLNLKKNRHRSFLPFNENRTCREIPGFYISASDVITPSGNYIMAQAPIKATVEDFFRMLIEKRSPLIITLVMPKEKRTSKCYPFWKRSLFPIQINEWRVERVDQSKVVIAASTPSNQRVPGSHKITERRFRCSNSTSGDIFHVSQLHYENWPDNGVPEFPLFLNLLEHVESLRLPRHTPITVHCSAGIGRTGTFVAAHSLRRRVIENLRNKNFRVNIPKEVLKMRRQRHSLIATAKQLQIVYKAIAAAGDKK